MLHKSNQPYAKNPTEFGGRKTEDKNTIMLENDSFQPIDIILAISMVFFDIATLCVRVHVVYLIDRDPELCNVEPSSPLFVSMIPQYLQTPMDPVGSDGTNAPLLVNLNRSL